MSYTDRSLVLQRRPPNSQLWISTSESAPSPGPLVVHERIDSRSIRRLKRQRDSGRLSAIECGERPVQDQPLEQVCWEGLRWGGPGALRAADDQEPRLCRRAREVPHRSSEQVLEPPDHVLAVDACTVVRFERDELVHRSNVGQRQDVQAAGRGLAVGAERRPAGDHRLREPVHVRPVLLQQLRVVTKLCHIGGISAVHEEVQLQQSLRRVDLGECFEMIPTFRTWFAL